MKRIALAVAMMVATGGAVAQGSIDDEIKQLDEAARLADAKKKKADAEAALVESNRKLLEAKAAQERAGDEAAKAALTLGTARKAAELDQDVTDLKKLKELFGDVPKVGREGTVSISESSTNQLLAIRAGSIEATQEVARRMCAAMQGKVTNAFFAPADLDVKVQRTRLFLGELDGVYQLVRAAQTRLDGIQTASVTAVVAAMTAARYLLGGADELSKVFRGDYAATVASTARSNLLEALVAGSCPVSVTTVGLESVLRLTVDTSIRSKLDAMVSFVVDHEGRSAAVAQEIARIKPLLDAAVAREAQLTADLRKLDDDHAKAVGDAKKKAQEAASTAKPPAGEAANAKPGAKIADPDPGYGKKRSAIDTDLREAKRNVANLKERTEGLYGSSKDLKAIEATASRAKAFLEGLKANATAFAEAVAWSGYDTVTLGGARLADRQRLAYVLTAQDAQVTVDRAFVGRRVDSLSTVEVVFQVTTADGQLKSGGAFSVTRLREKIAFSGAEPVPDQATAP